MDNNENILVEKKLFEEIQFLINQYQLATTGRKQLLIMIREKIALIRKYTNLFNQELDKIETYYSYRDYYVSDYKLVMRLLLRLANEEKNIYDMKKIIATDFIRTNGDEFKQIYGETLIIGEKKVLDLIDDKRLYIDNEFSDISSRIISNGNSLIIVTYNYFNGNVKPKYNSLSNVTKACIKNGGMVGDISCFLHNGALKISVDKFVKYIDVNGPDFQNIDENILYDLILNMNTKAKAFIKNNW